MKQKMVVNVTMNGQKSRSKALKIAVGLSGVESASLKGDDKSQIEVTGDGVDPVQLTSLIRKSVGYAELVSVSAVEGEKKEEKKEDGEKKKEKKKKKLMRKGKGVLAEEAYEDGEEKKKKKKNKLMRIGKGVLKGAVVIFHLIEIPLGNTFFCL
ncbi:hypothetical protein CRYUN_Cryun05aG0043700 [Craigia yunnanensis]